jgi:hypothetical protein
VKLTLTAPGVELAPARAVLVRRLGGLSRWEVGLHGGGRVPPLARAAALLAAAAAPATLVAGNVALAEQLRLVGGREDDQGAWLEFSEAALKGEHLDTRHRAHADDAKKSRTLADLFHLVTQSVAVDDSARNGLYGTRAPALLQDGISLVDLALWAVAGYQLIPGATPLTVTGRTTLRVVPAEAPDSARSVGPKEKPGFELVAVESVGDDGFRTRSSHGRVPVAVLGRRDPEVTARRLPELVKDRLGKAADLPWRAEVSLGKGLGSVKGTVVWTRDTFAVSNKTLSWEQRVGVRPAGWPAPRPPAGPPPRLVFGEVVKGEGEEPQHLVRLKLDGYEAGYDTIPAQLVSAYTGADGKGGLHFRPAPGTRAAALLPPRPDLMPVLVGNLRGPEVTFPAPSVVVPAVTVAGGGGAEFKLVADRGLVVTEREGKFVLSATADGVSVDAKDKTAKVSAKQVQVKSDSPVKVNSVDVTFQ